MPKNCIHCGKSYKHQRSLNRHIKERHSVIEHWRCIVDGCTSKFIRRSYLSRHLILCHDYSAIEARELALTAPRGDSPTKGRYYEDVSGDDTVLDIIAELDELRQLQQLTSATFSVDDYLSEMECSVSIGDANLLDISLRSAEDECDIKCDSNSAVERCDVSSAANEDVKSEVSIAANESDVGISADETDVKSAANEMLNVESDVNSATEEECNVERDDSSAAEESDVNGAEEERNIDRDVSSVTESERDDGSTTTEDQLDVKDGSGESNELSDVNGEEDDNLL